MGERERERCDFTYVSPVTGEVPGEGDPGDEGGLHGA